MPYIKKVQLPDGTSYDIKENSVTISKDDLDSTYDNGWYKLQEVNILGNTYSYCYMRVDAYNTTACTQTIYPVSSTIKIYKRNRKSSEWSEWKEVSPSIFLPKSGGTITSTTSDTPLYLQSDTTSSFIGFKDVDGNVLGFYGYSPTNGALVHENNSTYKVYHEGNKPTLSDLGITATTTELNYVDGVTSNIQTQLNNRLRLDVGTKIPDSSDLNDYTTPGKYYCGSGTNAATLTNAPMSSSGFGLIVMDGYIDGRVWQFGFGTGGEIKLRYYSGSAWYGWYELLTNVLDNTTYGTSLPTAGTAGRIFFKKV